MNIEVHGYKWTDILQSLELAREMLEREADRQMNEGERETWIADADRIYFLGSAIRTQLGWEPA